MMKTIKLGLIQLNCSEDHSKNIDKTIEHIHKVANKGAKVILLQELFSAPYFCQTIDNQYFDWAEPLDGPLIHQFCDLAGELGVVICVPFFEYRAAGIYHNSVAVIDADGTLLGSARKKHIPDDPGFHEKYYFTSGDDPYKVFETKYVKIGPLICWDQWYPEAARITALKGVELLVFPSAIGTLPDEDEAQKREFLNAWQIIQRSHAIANGCFVAAVNRVGKEGSLNFWGHSFVAGPFGQIIDEAGDEEQLLITEIDLSRIENQRQSWPFFRDRRVDTYGPILERYLE